VSLSSRNGVSTCLQVEKVANRARRARGPFIALGKNLPVGGVRGPDMSGLGTGHV
jgi:hypothetical protein